MSRDVLSKPASFQDVFKRKPGVDQCNTHYCAGCGHGVTHKLIAEAISDLGLQDRVIFAAPVGCAVFLYYYFECSAVSVPHGRAPSALTGISRFHPEAVVISYQGDGDLAAIGTNNIIHAANRGENIAVFFVNNAIYGMTGGQMAPTTLIGMKTTTSPTGRTSANEGYPIAMSEIISTLRAPIYVERVSLDSPASTMRARKAIRKALQLQAEGRGFSFVEILSPCPTNWKIAPDKTGEWMRQNMLPVFKPGVFKDISGESEPLIRDKRTVTADDLYALMGVGPEDDTLPAGNRIPEGAPVRFRFAGFGGQGVLSLGVMMAQAGMLAGWRVAWMPSYGPEMRGGTANSTVVLSPVAIGSPMVSELDVLVAMNGPSIERFVSQVRPGGLLLYNSSIVDEEPVESAEISWCSVPATDLAIEAGDMRTANTVMLGVYNRMAGLFDEATLEGAIRASFDRVDLVAVNRRALLAGAEYAARELV